MKDKQTLEEFWKKVKEPLKSEAKEDGVTTLEEYVTWFNGYFRGYQQRCVENMEALK